MAKLFFSPATSNWQMRHNAAILGHSKPTLEAAVIQMLKGWEQYAVSHRRMFEFLIGEDPVLGPAWKDVGAGLRSLLNGDLGRLHGGTVDAFIRDTAKEHGVNYE